MRNIAQYHSRSFVTVVTHFLKNYFTSSKIYVWLFTFESLYNCWDKKYVKNRCLGSVKRSLTPSVFVILRPKTLRTLGWTLVFLNIHFLLWQYVFTNLKKGEWKGFGADNLKSNYLKDPPKDCDSFNECTY